ncbi:MAG: nucleotidyltransferase domain-containing protein [Candidatus Aenigmarchaeota archaeon]|nr:nucleotidyltransferase domain-containing protein [Candidatus Aenigmarchaeota archaeon]
MKKPYVIKENHKLYIDTGIQKVVNILFKYPDKEFSLSDLAKEAGVAKANIGAMLEQLNRANFLEIIRLSKIWRIKARQESWEFRRAKMIYNYNMIYQADLVNFLNDYYKNPKAVILFGSFRRGEDITNSDIDIAVETDRGEYRIEEIKELSEIENFMERRIQIHLFNRKNVDINVFNNIANGIVLSGFLEVKP